MRTKTLNNIKNIFILIFLICFLGTFLFIGCDGTHIITDKDFSDKSYVALGDSITYGMDGMNSGKQMQYPYPDLIKKQLKLKSAANYGISGSTLTAETTNSYEPMSKRYIDMSEADIVSVLGGVNDYLNNIPLGIKSDSTNNTIYGALRTLCEGLQVKYSSSFIFFMTPYKVINRPINELGYVLEDVANAIKEVCSEYQFPVLDLYNLGGYEREAEKPESDKLHPSQQFVKKYMSIQISQFIVDNYVF